MSGQTLRHAQRNPESTSHNHRNTLAGMHSQTPVIRESDEFISPFDAFELIREQCWRRGRPLVPLCGAGCSVDAGIPLISSVFEYLKGLQWCYAMGRLPGIHRPQTRQEPFSQHDYLCRFGWPDSHDLDQFIAGRCGATSVGVLRRDALRSLQLDENTQWWELFEALTGSDKGLKDVYFDRLVRDAIPSTTHQYAAFLAHAMDWRLILTTNFDRLFEIALHDQGITSTVYELSESGELPNPDLVRANRAIIKLHGGAFGVMAGAILGVPLDFNRREAFLQYVPSDALLLVIGYGGADKRVTDLVSRICTRSSPMSVRALWVCRRDIPKSVADVPGIQFVKYRESGPFLQELYSRLTTSHPVSTTSYRALAQVPPVPRPPTCEDINLGCVRVVVFHRYSNNYGTSEALARYAASSERQVIWCHLEQIPNVDSLISHLQAEFRRWDPTLPPFAIFRPTTSVREPSCRVFRRDDPRLRYIVNALKRGRYLVAIDSMGEFAQPFRANNPTAESTANREQEHLRTFLVELFQHHDDFGESVLAVSFNPRYEGDTWTIDFGDEHSPTRVTLPRDEQWWGFPDVAFIPVRRDPVHSQWPVALVDHDVGSGGDTIVVAKLEALKSIGAEGCADAIKAVVAAGATAGARDWLAALVRLLWQHIRDSKVQLLLIVAAAFRRSRSIVGLRRMVIPLWKELRQHQETTHVSLELFEHSCAGIWYLPTTRSERDELDRMIATLDRLGILVHQEGGFLWMHRIVRQALFQECVGAGTEDATRGLAAIHDMIARYYYDALFRPSKDRAAFVEYLYHRSESFRGGNGQDLTNRLEDLNTVLQRHRDALLSELQPDTLIAWIAEIRDEILTDTFETALQCGDVNKDRLATIHKQLRTTLCDLEVEGRRQKNDLYSCVAYRFEQIGDRVREAAQLRAAAHTPNEDTGTSHHWQSQQQWVDYATDVRSAFPSNAQTDQHPESARQLDEAVRQFSQLLDNEVRLLIRCPGNLQAAIDGFRLVEHMIDIAACLTGLSFHSHNFSSVQTRSRKKEGAESHVARSILVQVKETIQETLTGGFVARTEATVLNTLALRSLIRACFRLMENNLSGLDLWSPPPKDELEIIIDDSNQWFSEGMTFLREFRGVESRDYLHYSCFLNCLRGRVAYIAHDFLLAYQLLDAAEAAITPPQSGSERSAIAVCHLFRAECLMLDADFRLKTRALDERGGRKYLERVDIELGRAQRMLYSGRPHVIWWTVAYIMEAQCQHEWLVLFYCKPRPDVEAILRMNDLDGELLSYEMNEHLRNGLAARRMGVDCVRQDPKREAQLRVLLEQFYVCHLLGCALRGVEAFQDVATEWADLTVAAEMERNVAEIETGDQWWAEVRRRLAASDEMENMREFLLDIERDFLVTGEWAHDGLTPGRGQSRRKSKAGRGKKASGQVKRPRRPTKRASP